MECICDEIANHETSQFRSKMALGIQTPTISKQCQQQIKHDDGSSSSNEEEGGDDSDGTSLVLDVVAGLLHFLFRRPTNFQRRGDE